MNATRPFLITAQYHAPRGKRRLYMLAAELSQRYLSPYDLLIGIIGSEGSGKSTLIHGLFPGLELTNDDDGVNNTPAPLYGDLENNYFAGHTFHVDIRYELAFKQKFQIVEAVKNAIEHEKRVVIEHFDLIYEALGFNAQVIFAIGEDLRIYRPTVFGPSPLSIKEDVDVKNKFRLMAHTAEDITCNILSNEYNYDLPKFHSDVKHGFVVGFKGKPDFDIRGLEKKVKRIISDDLPVKPGVGNDISVGDMTIYCTSKRSHVKSTGQIERFRLVKKFKYDPIAKEYLLVGLAGKESVFGFHTLPPVGMDENEGE